MLLALTRQQQFFPRRLNSPALDDAKMVAFDSSENVSCGELEREFGPLTCIGAAAHLRKQIA
jgi:hypothetical protein